MAEMMSDMPRGVDTSEGSLIYNSCAKQAVKLEEAYRYMAGIERNMFADTADREHLIRAGNERPCYIREATFAEFEAQFNCAIPAGSRFNCDEYNYTVFNVVDDVAHKYRVGCESAGSDPNHLLGELEPIDFVEGFEWGKLLRCTLPGEDAEETEAYRARVMATYNYRGSGGNREFYLTRIKELPGVMGCKMDRVKAPTDKIKAIIIGDNYRAPSPEQITAIQTAVDPIVNSGEGYGIAPIGHRVNVMAVGEKEINVETRITYDAGKDYSSLKSYIEKAIDDYLLSLRKTWEASDNIIVRILQIEAAIVSISGILDVTATKINGLEQNLQITDGTVPIRGVVTCL